MGNISLQRNNFKQDHELENSPSTMTLENDFLHQFNFKQNPVENHPFYHCIQPLLLLQKIGGGWIHRPLTSTNEKFQYYAFQMYCIFWGLITICTSIRIPFTFKKGISVNTENILTIMQVSFYVTTCMSQFASFFKYRQILSFWDGLVHLYPQRFNDGLRWQKYIIWVLTITAICQLTAMVASALYFILKADPDPIYIKLAEPWTGSAKEARVAFLTATISLFPSYITWICAGHLFVVSSYYLRWGFKDLQGRMTHETQLLNQLSLYKREHMFLSQMTRKLDDILWGYIGASMIMCTFDMCFVIFTLRDSHTTLGTIGSVVVLWMSLSTMTIIVLFSISINTWVSIETQSK